MAYRKTAAKRRTVGSDGSFWLSFSDLMSSLVLIIVLVLFYIIYQYFNLAEINQAEIARRQFALDEAQTALESRESELASAQAELETQQTKLTDAEKQMIAQQILLNAKEEELSSAQDVLAAQKTQLADAQSALSDQEAQIADAQSQLDALGAQLSAKQTEIDAQEKELASAKLQLASQQAQINDAQLALTDKAAQITDAQNQLQTQQAQLIAAQSALTDQEAQIADARNLLIYQQDQLENQQVQLETQQSQLENQQAQIEALVGMKTRIISSLSEAFRNSSIQATVDPANGSIALESDVLFESAKYKLTQRGQQSVDQVLPVYLNVLFSEEYRPYVAEVIIEGHTDSDGTWLNNLALSQQRALAVASYALGSDCRKLSPAMKEELRKVVTVNGRSWSDRVFNEDGSENKDASRRVVFKFRLTDEEMIRQLQTILEDK